MEQSETDSRGIAWYSVSGFPRSPLKSAQMVSKEEIKGLDHYEAPGINNMLHIASLADNSDHSSCLTGFMMLGDFDQASQRAQLLDWVTIVRPAIGSTCAA